ncbi:MAG TPA: DipZ protein [Solirubrobacter sp.]|nr:DipZ protein [Solirubrobacter sp.]
MLRMDQQRGKVVLLEFWDFCRVNSLHTLPYLKAWHERYAAHGLRVVQVHTGGFLPARSEANVRRAVERLGIEWPVVVDAELEIWDIYGNEGWPARYLWDQESTLYSLHYGEGAYTETELEIQSLLGVSQEPVAPVRPEDEPDALIVAPTPDQAGAYSGPYAAGGVWVVVDGAGTLSVDGAPFPVVEPGCFEVVAHERHTEAELALEAGEGVTVHATCFTPGLA